mgnify:CR=1 FL=1
MADYKSPFIIILCLFIGRTCANFQARLHQIINEESTVDAFILDIRQEVGYRGSNAVLKVTIQIYSKILLF